MNKINVSIIVPVYNSEKTLSRCIESILNQSYSEFELLLIDDGSSDKSYTICQEYSICDERVRLYHQENRGASSARNLGLEHVTGEYIMFVDADDHIEIDMLSVLLNYAVKEQAEFIMCGMVLDIYNKNGVLKTSITHTNPHRVITGNANIPEGIVDLVESEKISGPCCKLIKASIINEHKLRMPTHIALQEDLYFNLNVLSLVNKICIISEVLYHYNRGFGETVTTRYYASRYEMTNEVHDLLLDYYISRCRDFNVIKKINYIYIKNTYAALINLFHPKCKLRYREKIKYIKNITTSYKFNNTMKSAYKSGAKYRALKIVLETKSVFLIYYISKLFYLLKNKFGLKY